MNQGICAIIYWCLTIHCVLGDQWSDERLQKIDAIKYPPTSDEILFLSITSGIVQKDESRSEVAKRALAKLQSFQDLHNHFSNYIEEKKNEWKKNKSLSDYDRQRFWLIDSMGRVRDYRIVHALGEMLDDMEWTIDPAEYVRVGDSGAVRIGNGVLAARSLGNLIESPPIQKRADSYLESDVHPWRLWYAQVKAGTRTFRFKGDPQEYTLAGPVSEARTPQANRTAKAPATPAAGTPPHPGTTGKPLPVLPLAVAAALLGAASWFALWKKRGPASNG